MHSSDQPWVRIYRTSPWRRVFFYGLALGLMAAGWCVVTPTQTSGAFEARALLPAAVPLIAAIFSYLAGSYPRVELTPDSIRVRGMGGVMEAAWNNVAGVHLELLEKGFITREPMEGKEVERMASGARAYGWYGEQLFPLVTTRRFLRLTAFSWHLQHGDFVSLVQRFAPEIQLPETFAQSEQRLTSQRVAAAIVGLVMVALVALLVLFGVSHGTHHLGRDVSATLAATLPIIGAYGGARRRSLVLRILLTLVSAVVFIAVLLDVIDFFA